MKVFCSRNIIPISKTAGLDNTGVHYVKEHQYYGHIGVFVFDKDYLMKEYCRENTPLQLCEDIEWLKILEHGYKINSLLVDECEISVDTPQDYKYFIDKYGE